MTSSPIYVPTSEKASPACVCTKVLRERTVIAFPTDPGLATLQCKGLAKTKSVNPGSQHNESNCSDKLTTPDKGVIFPDGFVTGISVS